MNDNTYLNWVITNTKTSWWHDSADVGELAVALGRGAVGVTCNPYLSSVAIAKCRPKGDQEFEAVIAQHLPAEQQAEALMKIAVTRCAEMLLPEYQRTGGATGYVCAQVNPSRTGDRAAMLAMARRFHQWAPNIAVKLPGALSGLDVEEDCIAEGITTTITVSFTVPQVLAIAERHRKGIARAKANGIKPGRCYSVIMIGRLDDYLREVAQDAYPDVTESDIRWSGLACTKRAYQIYLERGYESELLVAALRGPYHLTELAGANLIMSIAPGPQVWFVKDDHPREARINCAVPPDALDRLRRMPEFLKAYEPEGMSPQEFIGYGVTQRTLSFFVEAGWKLMEGYK
ncbi:MAG: transaldolase family protein [Bryobacteraceae bacterium]|jgi:transaldolase